MLPLASRTQPEACSKQSQVAASELPSVDGYVLEPSPVRTLHHFSPPRSVVTLTIDLEFKFQTGEGNQQKYTVTGVLHTHIVLLAALAVKRLDRWHIAEAQCR